MSDSSPSDPSPPDVGAPAPRRLLIVFEGPQSALGLIRGLEYADLFEPAGFRVEFAARTFPFSCHRQPRPHERWMMRLVRGPAYQTMVRWLQRRIVRRARESDLVYLLGVPSIGLHRRLRQVPGLRVVIDVVDALWLPQHRRFGWEQFDEMVENSTVVICENEFIADDVRQRNPRVHVVPDSPQLHVFDRWRGRVDRNPKKVVLGWIGNPGTAVYLSAIWEALEELFARHDHLHLRILGVPPDRLPPFERVGYSLVPRYDQQRMVRELLAWDIGLFPLFHVEDARTRGTLKPRLYMSAAAVAACQDYGGSQTLIRDGVNGVLAGNTRQWLEKLDWLVTHPAERRRLAEAGLQTARAEFSREKCFQRLQRALEAALAEDATVDP